MRFRQLLLLPLLFLSCRCPEVRDVRRIPGEHLGTPEAAVWFFREAFLSGSTDNVYLAFSEALKEENPDLTVANVHTYSERIREFLEERIGSLEDVAPAGAPRFAPGEPNLAYLEVSDGRNAETLILVRERSATIQWTDGAFTHLDDDALAAAVRVTRAPSAPAPAPNSADPAAVVSLALVQTARPGARPEDVHRIDYAADWKFRGVVESDIGPELREFLEREMEAEEGTAPTGGS